jgi:predicted site-specific integrase-resolvase
MSLFEAERRNRQSKESRRTSQRILSFKQWCALNSISEATGRRLIKAGKVRIVRLSERRIGIGEDDNAEFQARCARAGT